MFTHLVLGGGGIKGCVITGALEALNKIFDINRIKYIIGSSAGGIVGTMFAVGYNPVELTEIFLKLNLAEYRDVKISNMLTTFGADDCTKLVRLLKAIIEQKVKKDITFQELYIKTGRTLILTGSNISDIKSVYFSRITYPNMKIIDAVRITLSYPVLFEPVKMDGKYMIDGAALDDYPIQYFKGVKRKIGIVLDTEKNEDVEHKINNFISYAGAVIFSIVKKFNKDLVRKNMKDTILINLPDIHALEFGISTETKSKLRDIGYKTTLDYMNNRIKLFHHHYLLKKHFCKWKIE